MNKLPFGWQVKKLGEIADFINGRAFKPEEWGTKGFPIIRIQNLTKSESVYNYFEGTIENRYQVKKNDILISWSASLDVYIWKGVAAVLNQHIFKVELDNTINRTFFFYLIKTKIAEMISHVHGSTMKHITKDRFDNIKVALPPLPIQKQIAEILEKADQAKHKRKEANQLTEQFLQSAFIEMFGDPATNPRKWKLCRVTEAVKYSEYGTSKKSNKDGSGYPILSMSNITYDGKIDLTKLSYVELTKKELLKLRLEKGDVIFNRTNSTELIGKTTCWDRDFDAVIASYLVKLRLNPGYSPIWFSYLLNTKYFKNLFALKCKKAVNQSNISPTLLKEFIMYSPSLSLQHQFAELVQKTETLKQKQKQSEQELENLFNVLMQKAFKGELV